MHMAFDRKYHRRKLNSLLWGAGAFFSLVALTAHAQSVAFTFDDGPNLEATPRLSAQQRNAAMLAALDKHGVKAALFVTAGNGANQPEGLALARAWGEAGHAIGNHTMTHPDLHSARLTLAQYQQEILDCDRIISTLPGYRKWFRYTFLREGNTPEKRDGMRAFLKQQGYRNAYEPGHQRLAPERGTGARAECRSARGRGAYPRRLPGAPEAARAGLPRLVAAAAGARHRAGHADAP
jgi:peptidoglycan/xylan/chitin deacetylase (PgdA/CDA1 family)